MLITLGTAAPVLAQAATVEALSAPVPETDFSIVGLFLIAGPVVKAVMLMLVAASVWCWAVIVERAMTFRAKARAIDQFEAEFWSGAPLEDLYDRVGTDPATPAERVFAAGMTEWNRSLVGGSVLPGTQARVQRAMSVAQAREAATMQRRLGFLATTGAVAPFIGLFGTVWGIKVAFQAIAGQQSTNLAVVAPGIAEALLATALGLLAAIPAVMAYNRLTQVADGLLDRLENFADEFATILGRQIDRAAMGGRAHAAD
ncbi:MAG: protein TolQ [Pseudomonadota bacterium]